MDKARLFSATGGELAAEVILLRLHWSQKETFSMAEIMDGLIELKLVESEAKHRPFKRTGQPSVNRWQSAPQRSHICCNIYILKENTCCLLATCSNPLSIDTLLSHAEISLVCWKVAENVPKIAFKANAGLK